MTGDCHVRIRGSVGVRFPRATRLSDVVPSVIMILMSRSERVCGNVMYCLASLYHEAGNSENKGGCYHKHARTVLLPDLNSNIKKT